MVCEEGGIRERRSQPNSLDDEILCAFSLALDYFNHSILKLTR